MRIGLAAGSTGVELHRDFDEEYPYLDLASLDVDQLKEDMSAPEIDQALKANLALADALNIHGTPGFIIGKHIVPGAVDLDALRNMIADARKE